VGMGREAMNIASSSPLVNEHESRTGLRQSNATCS
jgi:hypothetical protein